MSVATWIGAIQAGTWSVDGALVPPSGSAFPPSFTGVSLFGNPTLSLALMPGYVYTVTAQFTYNFTGGGLLYITQDNASIFDVVYTSTSPGVTVLTLTNYVIRPTAPYTILSFPVRDPSIPSSTVTTLTQNLDLTPPVYNVISINVSPAQSPGGAGLLVLLIQLYNQLSRKEQHRFKKLVRCTFCMPA
jgi:hypothetical protein